uniref:Uncharacterized protein n=1 Tax=Oryza brachyantha TaxID=4533 RepID=J3LBI6_ORYBR
MERLVRRWRCCLSPRPPHPFGLFPSSQSCRVRRPPFPSDSGDRSHRQRGGGVQVSRVDSVGGQIFLFYLCFSFSVQLKRSLASRPLVPV